jgi:transposase
MRGGDGGVRLGASLGRALIELGHEVRLLPPAHVKPYVRRNKSDQIDAAAIYEAMSRPGQRFVPVRSIDNQAALMRHRARELLAGQRTAALNALRGHLAEIGVVAPQGAQHAYGLKRMVPTASTRMARSSAPIACASRLVRLSVT